MPHLRRNYRRTERCLVDSGTGGWLRAALLSIAILSSPAIGQAAEDAASIRRDVEAILSSDGYQRDWPDASPPPKVETAPRTGDIPGQENEGASLQLDFDLAAVLDALKYVFGALIVAGIVVLLIRLIRKPRRTADTQAPPPEPTAKPASATRSLPLDEIERLAQAGRLEDAVHLLLLRFIDDIRARAASTVQPALTSREILNVATLTDTARTGLRRVVASVEESHFGGRSISLQTFEACLEGYRSFAAEQAGTR